MKLDAAFAADCPYLPEGMLIDEIVELDAAAGRVVATMPVHDELPLTRFQRVHPVKHPRHVNGGLMVHLTGMLAFVHAYYLLGLRHADGWVGYGARIREARFLALATVGTPLTLVSRAIRVRRSEANILATFEFEFSQGATRVYESQQTAMWLKVDENQQSPAAIESAAGLKSAD